MLIVNEYIERHLHECLQRKAELEKAICMLPSETLYINKNGSYYNWKISQPDGNLKYLKKSQEDLAVQLVLKETLEAELHDLKNEIEACERYLRFMNRSVKKLDEIFSDKNPEFKRLLGMACKTSDSRAAAWLNEPYERSAEYPEQLIVPTVIEELYVRSKLEANVAGNLFMLKIPSKYEKITRIGNIKIAVDYTALDVRTMKEIPIEVFGMMDNEEYRRYHNRKTNTYTNAGYIDGINFIAFHESSRSPLSPQIIRKKLEDFFFNNPPREL